jgi:hypothetical protein
MIVFLELQDTWPTLLVSPYGTLRMGLLMSLCSQLTLTKNGAKQHFHASVLTMELIKKYLSKELFVPDALSSPSIKILWTPENAQHASRILPGIVTATRV